MCRLCIKNGNIIYFLLYKTKFCVDYIVQAFCLWMNQKCKKNERNKCAEQCKQSSVSAY